MSHDLDLGDIIDQVKRRYDNVIAAGRDLAAAAPNLWTFTGWIDQAIGLVEDADAPLPANLVGRFAARCRELANGNRYLWRDLAGSIREHSPGWYEAVHNPDPDP